jgi:hypothetical protein
MVMPNRHKFRIWNKHIKKMDTMENCSMPTKNQTGVNMYHGEMIMAECLPTCQECGAQCCKVAFFACSDHQREFMQLTRGATRAGNGVLLPARCRHLNEQDMCSVYEQRPLACSMWSVNGEGCRMVREALTKGELS